MLSVTPLDASSPELSAICADPYVSRARHDHRDSSPIHHPEVHYLGAYVNGELVGAFTVVESGWIELDLHALLTRKALPHCRELGRKCLAYVFRDSLIQRVTAYVIEGLESARNYCLKLGFKTEGFRRSAVQRDGALFGVHVLGLTRADWEAAQ